MPKIWQKNEKNFLRNISSWYFQNLNSKYHQVSDNRSVTNLYTQFKSAICTRYIGMLRLPFTFEGYSLEIRGFRSTKCCSSEMFQSFLYFCIKKNTHFGTTIYFRFCISCNLMTSMWKLNTDQTEHSEGKM